MSRTARWTLSILILLSLACGSDDGPSAPPDSDAPQLVIDGELVGTWLGTVAQTATQEMANVTMDLRSDGSFTVDGDNPAFNPISLGAWGVVDGEFQGTGQVIGSPGQVEFRAPRSATRLVGTWASPGSDGTFDVTKQ